MAQNTPSPQKARQMDAALEELIDTRREREEFLDKQDDAILKARRTGLTYHEIAWALGISQPTVRRYYNRRLARQGVAA